jgi:hypothetical protein
VTQAGSENGGADAPPESAPGCLVFSSDFVPLVRSRYMSRTYGQLTPLRNRWGQNLIDSHHQR